MADRFRSCWAWLTPAVVASMLSIAPAAAVTSDPQGDFLPTFAGLPAADLDIAAAVVLIDGDTLQLGGVMFDRIGLSSDPTYVWGIDRGAGTPGLFTGTPSVGADVLFDAVLAFGPDGGGQLVAFNDGAPPTVTSLAAGTIGIFGSVSIARIPLALLPSRGFRTNQYSYNLWTRGGDGNAQIADLASNLNFFAEGVPEPGTWALLLVGFGFVGATLRKRVAIAATPA